MFLVHSGGGLMNTRWNLSSGVKRDFKEDMSFLGKRLFLLIRFPWRFVLVPLGILFGILLAITRPREFFGGCSKS